MMKRKKNNMWKKNFYTNISLLVCLVTVTALTAGCGSRKQDKEDSFEVVLVNAGSQLEKRDIEGFCDNLSPHPLPKETV